MTYCVTLTGCEGVSDASKRQAEGAFMQAIEHALDGGPAAVLQAHRDYQDCVSRYGGEPLPLDASAIDRDSVARWHDTVGAGREAAFMGWVRSPESAHFEINV